MFRALVSKSPAEGVRTSNHERHELRENLRNSGDTILINLTEYVRFAAD